MYRPTSLLDRTFLAAVIAKGLDGVLELVGGGLLLLLPPHRILQVVVRLTRGELSADPRDLIATHLLHAASGLTAGATLFGAAYLLVHGLVKAVLVVALLRDKLWAYPWMIAVLGVFIAYQAYRIVRAPSAGLVGLTAFDLLVVGLTWHEMRAHRGRRTSRPAGPPAGVPADQHHSPAV